jgi:hypothetical protein
VSAEHSGQQPDPLLELSVLIAAVAHDAAHPGVNSDFLIRTGDPLALLFYNDKSVLENMHAAICFRLLSDAESKLLEPLSLQQRAQVRSWIIAMILATDMKGHYALMVRLEGAATRGTSAPTSTKTSCSSGSRA